ncbi:ABC transporter substrate-binding protein [Microbaculum marinum]|uniref:ABC transporter substrate-binding protein n=1 Tax=Microbaculum marinum TaxID=1764581 RepID=A0AAW9RA75_9HYPH
MLAKLKPLLCAAGGLLLAMSVSAAADHDITIGAILPLTGPAAPIGLQEQQGVTFAVDRANADGGVQGHKIKVLFEDSQGKPDQGVLAFNRLVDLNDVPATLTAYSSISIAIAPLGTRREVLIINPAAQSDKLADASPFLFNTIPLVRDEAAVVARYALEKLGKKAAVIYENAAAGIDGAEDFKKVFVEAGGEIITEEPVEFGQTNFRSVLLKVAAAKPDFVYISVTQGQEAFAEQVGQIPNFPVAVGNTFSTPFFGYPSTVGWYHTAIKSGITPELEAEFNEKFDTKEMGFFSREYFNSTNILIQLIDHVLTAGKEVTGPNLRDALLEIKTFKSGIADITFETNTAQREVEIMQHGEKERIKIDYTPSK